MLIEKKSKKLKIGIIGCGLVAFVKHLPSLVKLENVEIVSFCDVSEERAKTAAQKFGTEGAGIYIDYRELLSDERLDVVHVCTANREHSIISVESLEAGKHVMCEKPMAINAKEAQKMLDAAKKTGKELTIGYDNRFRNDSQYLYKACRRGDLGEIYFARAQSICRRSVPTWGPFLNKKIQGGGPLVDVGSHALDLTLWLMNNYSPKMVVGSTFRKLADNPDIGNVTGPLDPKRAAWDPEEFEVEDSAFGFITMANGATIIMEASWLLNSLDEGVAKTTLCGTRGGADMQDGLRINGEEFGRLFVKTPEFNLAPSHSRGEEENAFDLQIRTWIDCLTKGTDKVVQPEQALVVTQILDAIYDSAETGRPVYF